MVFEKKRCEKAYGLIKLNMDLLTGFVELIISTPQTTFGF